MIEIKKIPHYHLLNIIKLVSVIAITVFHVNEFIFFEDFFPLTERTFIYPTFLKFAHLFPFSGHSIVSIVFFIWGFKQTTFSSLKKVLPILFIGQLLITLSFLEGRSFLEAWEWDIYCYLFVAILCLKLIQNFSQKFFKLTMLVCVALFVLSPWVQASYFGNSIFSEIFIGRCSWGKTGAWPLFPWIGLPLFCYSAGQLLKERGRLFHFNEMIFWFFVLIWTPVTWGKLYQAPIGPQFYCYMFNQAEFIFWGNFLIVLFMMRLSLVERIQVKLDQMKFVRWLSQLHWSRHLGLCYLSEILILCLLSNAGPFFQQYPIAFDLMFLALLPLIEGVVASLIKVRKRVFLGQKN